MNAYLLITFDGDSEEQLDEMIEQASEVLLEAGALDILVADTPQLKRTPGPPVPPSWRPLRPTPSCWTRATWWCPSTRSPTM